MNLSKQIEIISISLSLSLFLQNEPIWLVYVYVMLQYAGVIPSVPLDVDVTNRTEVLRIIDAGKVRCHKQNWSTAYYWCRQGKMSQTELKYCVLLMQAR